MQVDTLSRSIPVTDDQFRPLQNLNLFSEAVAKLPVIIGSGSPESVITAEESRFYMDRAGAPGSVLYIKQLPDILGDKSQGWVAIG